MVDTDLIYPEDRAAGQTEHFQRRKEVCSDFELEAIDKYYLVEDVLTPSVGKRGIFGLVIKEDHLQFTDERAVIVIVIVICGVYEQDADLIPLFRNRVALVKFSL